MARDVAEVESIAQRVISLLGSRIPVTRAHVFGSHAEPRAHEDSDLDIAAFRLAADAMSFPDRVEFLVRVERQLDAPVQLHLFGSNCLAEARPTNVSGYLLTHGKRID